MEYEDDIYGEDIYGGSATVPAGVASGTGLGGQAAAAAEYEKQLAEKTARIGDLEAQLQAAQSHIQDWQQVFREGTGSARSVTEPVKAVAELKRLRLASEKAPAEDVSSLKQREAALQMQLAEQNLENIELRRQAHTARQYADPNIAQIRQLLLDPAVEKEFARMKTELEEKCKEAKGLQEELQAVQFSQDSKVGRMLMAKCRALQDENEEMGKELAEGKMHSLERQVGLSKAYVEDMRARYLELEDHCHVLDAESEDLSQQVFMLRRQLREADMRTLGVGRDRAMRAPALKVNGQPPGFGPAGPSLPGPPGPAHSGRSLPLHSPERKRGPASLEPGFSKRLRSQLNP